MYIYNMIISKSFKNSLLFCFALLNSVYACSQSIDSAWVIENQLPAFNIPKNTDLPILKFTDVEGKEKSLADFKGKVLYVKLWSTFCAPCIGDFPYQEQLMKRIKKLNLDTSITFININIENTNADWKKALQKYNPVGINLHYGDSLIFNKWDFDAIPFFVIIDQNGNLIGKDTPGTSDSSIDWLLYCSAKNYDLTTSVWRSFTQGKLMEQHHSSKAFTDKEFATWFEKIFPSLIEFNEWRTSHEKKSH